MLKAKPKNAAPPKAKPKKIRKGDGSLVLENDMLDDLIKGKTHLKPDDQLDLPEAASISP
ncbi:hypothetical protein RUM43_004671 [Polyplax serrata]|uniref:Uncharacterized protein n=1 Tax=Polyplax serrata TaxID=468196 RepID=A0AAN8SB43_POLSC